MQYYIQYQNDEKHMYLGGLVAVLNQYKVKLGYMEDEVLVSVEGRHDPAKVMKTMMMMPGVVAVSAKPVFKYSP
jgi:hypothetical protein